MRNIEVAISRSPPRWIAEKGRRCLQILKSSYYSIRVNLRSLKSALICGKKKQPGTFYQKFNSLREQTSSFVNRYSLFDIQIN